MFDDFYSRCPSDPSHSQAHQLKNTFRSTKKISSWFFSIKPHETPLSHYLSCHQRSRRGGHLHNCHQPRLLRRSVGAWATWTRQEQRTVTGSEGTGRDGWRGEVGGKTGEPPGGSISYKLVIKDLYDICDYVWWYSFKTDGCTVFGTDVRFCTVTFTDEFPYDRGVRRNQATLQKARIVLSLPLGVVYSSLFVWVQREKRSDPHSTNHILKEDWTRILP